MARVRPFAAVRYAHAGTDLTPVTAPPYDVISPDERTALLEKNPHNVVALELAEGPVDPALPGNRYETAAETWRTWRDQGVLATDPQPSLYVLEQRYVIGQQSIRRRAVIAEVALEPFSAGVILPHERTLPKALGDRFELICATGANFSQVFGLFEDAAGQTDAAFQQVMAARPDATATDADGVESVLWMVTDPGLITAFTAVLADKPVFIADGHHRYTTALAYRDLRREQAETSGQAIPIDPAYDFVLMALVNMEDPDLVVLPTHRVANAAADFDAHAFLAALEPVFLAEEITSADVPGTLADANAPAFVVKLRGDERILHLTLRSHVNLDTLIDLPRSSAWKHLDVAVLQELILDPLLGIHPDRPETLDRLTFVKDATAALDMSADHDAVFILRSTRMEQLRAVATAGETMPQKSTYFYPKLLSGLVMRAAD